MKQKGFTLIELMIVVAIAGILSAILIPAMKSETDNVVELNQLDKQGQDRRTCVANGMNFEVVNGKVSCLPKPEETTPKSEGRTVTVTTVTTVIQE